MNKQQQKTVQASVNTSQSINIDMHAYNNLHFSINIYIILVQIACITYF